MAPGVRFEHGAFSLGLGLVAGSLDTFGFVALYGLLPAHVIGNLVLLALELAHGQRGVGMKLAALPIFALGSAASAWWIGNSDESFRVSTKAGQSQCRVDRTPATMIHLQPHRSLAKSG